MENERPQPSKSATLYSVGTIKTGNDENNKIIEKLKKHIIKQKDITHATFNFVSLKDNKLESNNIWSYTK